MADKRRDFNENNTSEQQLLEKVVRINRINKVVKGGKRLGFRAFVIVGNMQGEVGIGLGKSKEVPAAIKKGIDRAKKYQNRINIVEGTVPHQVEAKFGASKVLIKPAPDGTGVIAGGAVKVLLEAAGLKNVVAKTLGARNPFNSARAALIALLSCKDLEIEQQNRGKKLPVFVKKLERGKA